MEFNSQTTHILKIIANSNYEPNDSPICIDCLIVKCKGSNPAIPTLFVEIDYMYDGSTSFKPTTDMNLNGAPYTFDPENDVIDYFIYYYQTLGVEVKPIIDERISISKVDLNNNNKLDLTSDSDTPYHDPTSSREQLHAEQNYHDHDKTHLYILYSGIQIVVTWIEGGVTKSYKIPGTSSPRAGAVIKPFTEEGTGHWTYENFGLGWEKQLLLHEIGHCIYVGEYDDYDIDGDGYVNEIYCGSDEDLTGGYDWCVMSSPSSESAVKYPTYCEECWSTHEINLYTLWSVGENAHSEGITVA